MIQDRRKHAMDPRRASAIGGWKFWIYCDTRIAEVLSALVALYWAIDLALFDVFATSKIYHTMNEIMGQSKWAALFGAVWATQSLATCWNVWHLRYPGAALAFLVWSFMASSLAFSTPIAPAVGTYGLMALLQAWVIWRGPTDGRF